MEIVRRLGVPPTERGSLGNANCPDLFETDRGFAAIGDDLTAEFERQHPGRLGPGQRIVVVTRDTLLKAKEDIPVD